jgi:hypothetical protein
MRNLQVSIREMWKGIKILTQMGPFVRKFCKKICKYVYTFEIYLFSVQSELFQFKMCPSKQ